MKYFTLITVMIFIVALPQSNIAYKPPAKKIEKVIKATLSSEQSGLEDIAKEFAEFKNIGDEKSKNFLLGYADFKRGRWHEADAFFRLAGNLEPVRDYILYYRAVIAVNIGRFNSALEMLGELASTYPDSVLSCDAMFERGRALAGTKNYSEAIRSFADFKGCTSKDRTFYADKEIIRTHILSGDFDTAEDILKREVLSLACEEDISEFSDVTSELKRKNGFDLEGWLGGTDVGIILVQSFMSNSEYADAAARLEKILSKGVSNEFSARAKWMLAQCYRWIGRYDEAIVLMEELKKDPSSHVSVGSLYGTLATVYAKKDDYEKAIETRKEMLTLSGGSRFAATVAFKVAFLYVDQGKYEEAIPLWKKVISMRGGKKQGGQARWFLAWCYYMLGRYDEAISAFDSVIKSDGMSDRAMYWKARIYEKTDRAATARSIYEEIISKHPNGYYAELSRRRIAGDVRTAVNFTDVASHSKVRSKWKPSDTAANGNPRLSRVVFFDRLGLWEDATRELSAVSCSSNSGLIEEVMWYASKNYAHNISYRLVYSYYSSVLKSQFDSPQGFDRFVWEQGYPRAYSSILEPYASARGVDSYLVWSLMKNESNFKPSVVSPAGAVGLLQLMPTTAERYRDAAGYPGAGFRELFKPKANIAISTNYIRELGSLFPGNPVAVIASYNAGEEAVARWLSNGPMNDVEEWIEEIPYAETNNYVKKVLASYWIYRRLY